MASRRVAVPFARLGRFLVAVWQAGPVSAVLMVAAVAVGGIAPTFTASLSRAVLDGLTGAPRAGGTAVLVLAGGLGLAGLVTAVVPIVRRYLSEGLRRAVGLLVQDRLCCAVNADPGLSRFETPAFVDKLRLAQEASNSTPGRLVTILSGVGQGLITAIGLIVVLAAVSPAMAGIVVLAAAPTVIGQFALSRKRADLQWRQSPAYRRELFYRGLQTELRAAKELRLFGLGDFLRGRMLRELRSINTGQRALDGRTCRTQLWFAGLAALVTGGGVLWVVGQAASGHLSVGDVSMFVFAVAGVQSALGSLVGQLADGYQALRLFGYFLDVVTDAPALPIADSPVALPALRRGIEIDDVWFRYDENHPWVLRGVTLFLPHGASAALVGLNGAGKSTLVKLICRFYDPQRGAIRWDGVDIRDLDPTELRDRIGAVFQDYMAYDLSAAENIGIGDLDRLDDRPAIRAAAAHTDLDALLDGLPHGYDTLLSRIFADNVEHVDDPRNATGVVLSGGQWQRLAVARGLMRDDRDLLILDEPTSGLDAEAEHAIHARLCAMRADRTSLLISHRLGAIRDADTIFVLEQGRIVEQGTHAALLAADGRYAHLFNLQAAGYHDEAQPPSRMDRSSLASRTSAASRRS